MFTKHINTEIDNLDEKNLEKLKKYKDKMTYMFLLGFICFFIMGIFGYLFNCKFLSFHNRVSGVSKFIVFLIIFMVLKYFETRNEKYNIKKEKIDRKRRFDAKYRSVIIISTMITCFGLTLILFIINFI